MRERIKRAPKESKEHTEERPARRFGDKPHGDRPQGDRQFSDRPRRRFDDKPHGDRPRGDRPFSDRPRRRFDDKPRGDRPQGDRPFSDRPRRRFDDKPHGDRPQGDRPFSDRPRRRFDDKPHGDRPYGDRPFSDRPRRRFDDKPHGDRPQGDRPFSDRPRRRFDDKPHGDRPQGDRPFSDRPRRRFDDKPRGDRPYGDRKFSDRPRRRFDDKPKASFSSASKPSPRKRGEEPARKQASDPNTVRLNKFIANSGICSRREADEYITTGLITVNDKVVTELGTKINVDDEVKFNGQRLKGEKKVYIIMNKPKDFVTTTSDPHAEKSVMDLINPALCPERVFPIGRLDKSTTGVLLFTNDGALTETLTHPSYNRKKIYQVTLDKNLKKTDFEQILSGIELEDGPVAADTLSYIGEHEDQVGIEIHSGRNRVVRRIFESLGYDVKKLDRVYFAGLTKKYIRRGQWRFLTDQEIATLKMGSYE